MSTRKRHVTFVLPFAENNGGLRVVGIYASKLLERGHEVFVVSEPYPATPFLKAMWYRITGRSAKLAPRKTSPLIERLGHRHKVLERPRAVEAKDIPDGDAVFATWWLTVPAVDALPASKGAKFHLMQDYEMFDYFSPEDVKATYETTLHKIAVSHYIATEVSRNHNQTDIAVVPNAVDLEQFESPARHKAVRPTVGFLYTKTARKQVSLAIEAVERARQHVPELRVLAFGREEPELLPPWVEYHQEPAQADIPKLYAACDAWLFTSKTEGFGLPILEAMACRTPVLATRAGAAPELINGKNGVLLEQNAEAFASEIVRFAQMNDAEWHAYSQAAYQTPLSYTWDDATDRLLACIEARLP